MDRYYGASPSWEKHELSPSVHNCKPNCIILNNIIICTES